MIAPYEPNKTDLSAMLEGPSLAHPMGTDELGRDLFTRILYGGRVSLAVGFLAVALSVTIGTAVGALAGYYGGWLDNALMRVVDFMLCLPTIFVLILLATLFGTNPLTIVLVIGGLRWMSTSRLVRGSFLALREREFVEAARCLGAGPGRIMFRHVLPNSAGPIIVAATLGVAAAILTESSLSYLGLGIQPPMASWGNMLRNAQTQMVRAPWTAIFPGLMIFLTVLAMNYVGDGLRDALDPRKSEGPACAEARAAPRSGAARQVPFPLGAAPVTGYRPGHDVVTLSPLCRLPGPCRGAAGSGRPGSGRRGRS